MQTESAAPGARNAPFELTPAGLHRQFRQAFVPRPRVYWCDMLLSMALGWSAFVVATQASPGSTRQLFAAAIAIFALYRAALFIHELAHLRRGAVRGLETVWNLLIGFPLMVPSIMYVGSHNEHHRRGIFGTPEDPEYDRIAQWRPARIVASSFVMVAVPGLLALRWGVLGPLSALVPPLRTFIVARMSTLVINAGYHRPPPRGREVTRWAAQEAGAAIYFWIGVAGVLMGWIPLSWIVLWYCLGVGILTLNHLRTLAAHRYANDGSSLDAMGQLLDSVNLQGKTFLTAFVAPVGLRYHALHHFVPTLPYHSLGLVHRRLLENLPTNSPYRATQAAGVLVTLTSLLHKARRHAADLRTEGAGGSA